MKSVILVLFLSLSFFAQAEVSCVLTTMKGTEVESAVRTPLAITFGNENYIHMFGKQGEISATYHESMQGNYGSLQINIEEVGVKAPLHFNENGLAELTASKGFSKPDGTLVMLECRKK